MSLGPVRFLHAAELFLDEPLEQTAAAGEDLRETIESATLTAFDRLVTACIEQQVDFLLLAGNTFREKSASLPARLALLQGFSRLAEADIRVVVVPGEADPPAAWQAIADLPENVTVLAPQEASPFSISADERLLATLDSSDELSGETAHPDEAGSPLHLVVIDSSTEARETDDDDSEPNEATFQAGNPPCYLVPRDGGPCRTQRLDGGLLHHPGPLQGRLVSQTGRCGATVVTAGDDGQLDLQPLPLAVVRREQFTVEIDSETTAETLRQQMCSALESSERPAGEAAWLIRWTIVGDGPLFDALDDPGGQQNVLPAVGEECAVCHEFRLIRQRQSATEFQPKSPGKDEEPNTEHDSAAGGEVPQDVASEYFRLLEAEDPVDRETLAWCLEEAAVPAKMGKARLESLVDRLEAAAVAGKARELGARWFAAESEEGPAS